MATQPNPVQQLAEGSRSARALVGLLAGLVVGVVVVIVAISFAVLIFSGDLEAFSSNGIGLALFTAVVMAGVIAVTSSYRGMVATPQDVPAAITALIAAAVAAGLPAATASGEVFITVVAAIAITSLTTGLLFLALGFFHLGGLIRFIPYPVIGGFLAGTGWLLVKGSFGVLTGVSLSFANLQRLVEPEMLIRWLPGLIFSVALLAVLRRVQHFLVLPGMLLAAIAVFYLLLAATGTSVAEATSRGWLLGPFPTGDIWRPLSLEALGGVHWGAIAEQSGSILALVMVGVVALLLNASGLELVIQQDIDLDQELRGAGVANILSGLGGGLVGFQTLSLSTLGHRMVPDSRLVGLVSAGVCAATLVTGSSFLSLFPKAVLGGLLLFLGLAFLTEWVYDSWFKLPRVDYFVVLVILLVIATVGFLESVGTGVVIAVILFVVNYSRIDVVKHALSGATRRSNVERPTAHGRVLRDHGDELFILQLQGFIFFGTANSLFQCVRVRMHDDTLPTVRYLVLDFRLVSGIDSSAVLSFVKLHQLAEAREMVLIIADCSAETRHQLERGAFPAADEGVVRWLPELDRAIEWCENRILRAQGIALAEARVPLQDRLHQVLPESVDVTRVMDYLERMEVPARHYLMHQGDPPDDLFFIESGQVTVQMELGDEQTVRLLTMGAGTVVGEMELYLGRPRSASVITEEASIVYRLTAEKLAEMQRAEPEIAAAFHEFFARLMADRLTANHRTLEALLR